MESLSFSLLSLAVLCVPGASSSATVCCPCSSPLTSSLSADVQSPFLPVVLLLLLGEDDGCRASVWSSYGARTRWATSRSGSRSQTDTSNLVGITAKFPANGPLVRGCKRMRMLLHGFLHAVTANTKHCPVKLKTAQTIWVLMCVLAVSEIGHAVEFGDSKAVFSTPCGDIMTLSTPVPNLTQFTVCTYLKLASSKPWTAFIYKLPSSPDNVYEIGVFGDSGSMKIWMFGTEIIVLESLNLLTWYEICITWGGRNESMGVYLNGEMKAEEKLENNTMLHGGGSLILGCPHKINASASLGLVGDLYMFRMWNTSADSWLQSCIDGNVIKWKMDDWIYSPTIIKQDSSLHCANKKSEITTSVGDSYLARTPTQSNGTVTTSLNSTSIAFSSSSATNITTVNELNSDGSFSSKLWKSSVTTNINSGMNNYSNSSTSLTTSFSKHTSDVNNGLNITSESSHSSSDSSYTAIVSNNETFTTPRTTTTDVTTGGMNCTANASSEIQNWLMGICNSSCNGSVYEITLEPNCPLDVWNTMIGRVTNISHKRIQCTDLLYIVNYSLTDICVVIRNYLGNVCIKDINKIDFCCCTECSLSPCIIRNTAMCGFGGNGATTGFPNTRSSNSQLPSITRNSNGSSITKTITSVISRPAFTSYSGSNTPVNSQPTSAIRDEHDSTVNSGSTSATNRGSHTTTISGTRSVATGKDNTGPSTTSGSSSIIDSLNKLIDLLGSGNLNSSTVQNIVSQLEDLLAGEVTPDAANILVGILNTFLNVSQNLLAPVSKRLLMIVDKIGLKLNFPGQSINFTSQALALAVNKVKASSFTGTSFGVESSSGLQVSLGSQPTLNSDGSILLPASLLNDLSPIDKDIASRIQFNYFAKTSFFMDSSLTTNQSLVSKVISSSVANITVTNLTENVTVTLKTFRSSVSNSVKCVFWDFTKNNGSGGWASDGCTVASRTHTNNETVCNCNHLTSFAILLDVTPNTPISPQDTLILTFITYIGCGLSSIFLSVTLVTYIAFEKIRRDYPSKILIQLCAALVCLNLTFLLNPWISLYSDIPGLCISVAAFLHYFVLVSITWMGLEAFHMYLSLVKVFNTYVRKYMLKFCIIGWGVPAVVVAIILAVKKDLYRLNVSVPYPNGSADYFCWMDDTVFWITIVGYFGIIFLLNVSMFVVVLIQLCRIKKQKQLGYQRKTTLQDMRSVAGITFLLGITWGLGFFSFGPGKVAIMYLFTIFNTLQGFFIFLFYCVAKENVRKQWRRYLCCGKFRLAENSDWSKTATNKLKKQTSKQGASSSSSNSIQSTSNSNSTTVLVSNEYSLHPNGNGNVLKERNGVSFQLRNSEMVLQELSARPSARNGDAKQTSIRRTSNRGSVHFIDQI
ncbi:adhesion G-protein coupled receptor G2 isoform X2 [Pseudophryne corroboree]|uniref:adhesion G-protein coupled receptor G2 isoform X2 n=1 Tax=Pseudophryne corroboree TaxID=495146 RepID=UPI0030820141